MPNELHFICTASARLGTGNILKKPPDADRRVLQAAFYKKKKPEPTNNGRCLTTQHPHRPICNLESAKNGKYRKRCT